MQLHELILKRWFGVLFAGVVGLATICLCCSPGESDVALNTGTFRTTNLIVDSVETVGTRTEWNPTLTRGVYISSNEIDQGYGYNADDTLFINYSGYNGGATRYRNLWVGEGRNGANPIIYTQAITARVGINTFSPLYSLDVTGTAHVSSHETVDGNLSVATGITSLGPLGGSGGFQLNPTTGASFFQPMTSTANPWGFGFVTSTPLAPVDIADLTYAPGTANPRTDDHPSLLRGLATANYDTTAGAILVDHLFLDAAIIKAAGANKLYSIAARFDANVTGGADYAVSLHLDKGVFWNSVHTIYAVRPSTGGGPTAPPVISACGAAPAGSATGNDNGGRITIGGGAPTSCTLTFQAQWLDHTGASFTPVCLVQDQSSSAIALTINTINSTTLTVTWTAGTPAIGYHCFGMDDTIPGP